jgi:hypothetical protein
VIDGKLTITRADNGWTLQWWERDGATPTPKCEVFDNADTFLTRIGHLTDSLAHKEFIEVFHHREDAGHTAEYDLPPGTADALVADLTPPGTPPTVRGDE